MIPSPTSLAVPGKHMIVVNPKISNLVAGYHLARQAENELLNRWRKKLQEAFERQKKQYRSQVVEYKKRRQATHRDILTGIAYILAGIGAGILCFLIPSLFKFSSNFLTISGIFIFTLTLVFGIGLGVFGLIQLALPKPKSPTDPLQTQIFPPIMPQWQTAMKTSLPPAIQAGDKGEHAFIHGLGYMLGNDYFLISGIQQRHGEDVDVILVGPKGVWVFEVKYWSGTIRWQSGVWSRFKTYHEQGGTLATEQKPISQPPDKQWERVAADVSKTIQRGCPELGARYLGGMAIKGGLVFTHTGAKYEIGPGFPISWGSSEWWAGHLMEAPKIPNWREADSISILDALLARHREIHPYSNTRSMLAQANQLVASSEAMISNWIQRH